MDAEMALPSHTPLDDTMGVVEEVQLLLAGELNDGES